MKKFKFRLEKVLQYREVIKNEKKRELLLRNLKLSEAQQRLEDLELAWSQNELANGGVMQVEQLYLSGQYAGYLKDAVVQQNLLIIELQEKVDEALAEYREAATDARALETLKERRRSEYMQKVAEHDAKFLDEIMIFRGNKRGEDLT